MQLGHVLSSTFGSTFEVKRELKRGPPFLYASWGLLCPLVALPILCPIETIIYGWKALNVSFLTHLKSPQLDIYNSSYSCLKYAPSCCLVPTFDLTFEANVSSNVAASRDAISLLFGANV
ncbi:uncharacterized protein DS421_11g332850 [Arachis hypogaea]|nr:uncharacterized protein DS421_11g332850 [Arachis hypogaea]